MNNDTMDPFANVDFFEYEGTKYYSRYYFIRHNPETEVKPEKYFMERHKIVGEPVLYGTYSSKEVWKHVPGWKKADDTHIPFHTRETLQKVLDRVKLNKLHTKLAGHRKKYKENVKTRVKAPKIVYDPSAKVLEAPPEIVMTGSEMYVDEDDEPIDIYMCGDRKVSRCYFLAASVEIGFRTDNINDIMLREKSGFSYRYHYEFFMYLGEKHLFLTYLGMMGMLKKTENPTITKFETWACGILFTVRHGSLKTKEKLVKKMMGLSFESIKKVFSTGKDNSPLSGIYLMALEGDDVLDNLGATPDETGGIPYKMGCSEDLVERMSRHKTTYGSIPTCVLSLVFSSYIDPVHKFDAETELKSWASRQKVLLEVKGHSELVYLTPKMLKKMKEEMEYLGKKYRGQLTALHNVLEKERTEHSRLLVEMKSAHLQERADAEKAHKAEMAKREAKHAEELKEYKDELKETRVELKETRAKHAEELKEYKDELKETRVELKETRAELKSVRDRHERLLLSLTDREPTINGSDDNDNGEKKSGGKKKSSSPAKK